MTARASLPLHNLSHETPVRVSFPALSHCVHPFHAHPTHTWVVSCAICTLFVELEVTFAGCARLFPMGAVTCNPDPELCTVWCCDPQVAAWGRVEAGHDLDETDMTTRISGPSLFVRLMMGAPKSV